MEQSERGRRSKQGREGRRKGGREGSVPQQRRKANTNKEGTEAEDEEGQAEATQGVERGAENRTNHVA